MKNIIEKMSKNTKIGLGLVVLVIIVALLVQYGIPKKPSPIDELKPIADEVVSTSITNPRSNTTSSVRSDTRTYSELILAYKDRTLQFNTMCQVHMSKQVYKVGSEVLLDNRSGVPAAIKIGPSIYNISAYSYKVVTLSSIGEFMIDCNDRENVATVTVQK